MAGTVSHMAFLANHASILQQEQVFLLVADLFAATCCGHANVGKTQVVARKRLYCLP